MASSIFSLCITLTAFLSFSGTAAAAERQLGRYENLLAIVPQEFSCDRQATVTVRAPNESVFTGEQIALQKLLGGLRIMLDFECPRLNQIILVGEVDGRKVYSGTAERNRNWVLTDTITQPLLASEQDKGKHTAKSQDAPNVIREWEETHQTLTDAAIEKLQTIGRDYTDALRVLEEAAKAATEFEKQQAETSAEEIYTAGVLRAEKIVEASYPQFLEELASLNPNPNVVAVLREQAFTFGERAQVITGFAAYQEAALNRAETLEQQWCDQNLTKAGFSEDDASRQVVSTQGDITLRELVCAASRNGYRVTKESPGFFSRLGFSSNEITLNLEEPSGDQLQVELSEVDKSPGKTVLIGQRFGEQEISREEWLWYAADLARPSISGIPDSNGITDCDRLAANPDDLQKVEDGVADESLDVESAIEACLLALEFDPENPRLQYQLGRGLYFFGDEDAAIELFDLADRSGYAIASYQLGDMLVAQGGEDEESLEAARDYYSRAAQGGHQAGQEMATQLDEWLALMRPSFTSKMFKKPQWTKAAYEGDFSEVNEGGARFYYMKMVGTYSQICPNALPAGFQESIFNTVMGEIFGGVSMNDPNAFAMKGLELFVESLTTMTQNPGKFMQDAIMQEKLEKYASEDIIQLTGYHECGSAKMNMFFDSIKNYIEGKK